MALGTEPAIRESRPSNELRQGLASFPERKRRARGTEKAGSIFQVQPQLSLDRLVCNDQSWRYRVRSMLVVSTWANIRGGWWDLLAGRLNWNDVEDGLAGDLAGETISRFRYLLPIEG